MTINADRLRALAEAATPGPWSVQGNGRDEWYVYALDARYESLPGNPSPVKVAWVPWAPSGGRDARDCAYIAAASPDAILALLAERDALERERDSACRTVALMHAAATGRHGDGPKRGVVEDIADLKAERDALAALLRECRDCVVYFAGSRGDYHTGLLARIDAALAARSK